MSFTIQTYVLGDYIVPSTYDQLTSPEKYNPEPPPPNIQTLMLIASISGTISILSLHTDIARLRYEVHRYKESTRKFNDEIRSLVQTCKKFAESVLWLGIEDNGDSSSEDGNSSRAGAVAVVGEDGEEVLIVDQSDESSSETGSGSGSDTVEGSNSNSSTVGIVGVNNNNTNNGTHVIRSNRDSTNLEIEDDCVELEGTTTKRTFHRFLSTIDGQFKGIRALLEMEPSPPIQEQISSAMNVVQVAANERGQKLNLEIPKTLTHSWFFAWTATIVSFLCQIVQLSILIYVINWEFDIIRHDDTKKLGMGGAMLVWVVLNLGVTVISYLGNLFRLMVEWLRERRTGRPTTMSVAERNLVRENRTMVYSVMSLILVYAVTTFAITKVEGWSYRWGEQWFISAISGIGFSLHNVETSGGKVLFMTAGLLGLLNVGILLFFASKRILEFLRKATIRSMKRFQEIRLARARMSFNLTTFPTFQSIHTLTHRTSTSNLDVRIGSGGNGNDVENQNPNGLFLTSKNPDSIFVAPSSNTPLPSPTPPPSGILATSTPTLPSSGLSNASTIGDSETSLANGSLNQTQLRQRVSIAEMPTTTSAKYNNTETTSSDTYTKVSQLSASSPSTVIQLDSTKTSGLKARRSLTTATSNSNIILPESLRDQTVSEKLEEMLDIIVGVVVILVLWIGGGAVFASIEGWQFVDGIYFTFTVLTTIGE
ncbi:hypothetical protein HDU76_011285 [Blyttiomyces sp. JEL0837]|nr:hypothetical protein HDU76_011285 [Blyttiomyces sp. JEL0837]